MQLELLGEFASVIWYHFTSGSFSGKAGHLMMLAPRFVLFCFLQAYSSGPRDVHIYICSYRLAYQLFYHIGQISFLSTSLSLVVAR